MNNLRLNLHVTEAPHHALAQSDLRFGGRYGLNHFKMVAIGHLGYRNKMLLAILNLHNTPMPTIKFQLSSIYGFAGVVWRISRWLPWHPSWISELKDFSNSDSPCHPNTSDQLSALSDLRFWSRCGLKTFKMATMVAVLDIEQNEFSILNLYIALMPSTKFRFSPTLQFGSR